MYMRPFSVAARRLHGLAAQHRAHLPADVDANSGLCAGGNVRISNSPSKGLGAFAEHRLPPGCAVGEYNGELLTLSAMHARYGTVAGYAAADVTWHREWSEERRRRGVGISGRYCFKWGSCPRTGRLLIIDGEDPQYANWTRFLNHSAKRPCLSASRAMHAEVPVIVFCSNREIEPGEELLFDYGEGYGFDGMVDE